MASPHTSLSGRQNSKFVLLQLSCGKSNGTGRGRSLALPFSSFFKRFSCSKDNYSTSTVSCKSKWLKLESHSKKFAMESQRAIGPWKVMNTFIRHQWWQYNRSARNKNPSRLYTERASNVFAVCQMPDLFKTSEQNNPSSFSYYYSDWWATLLAV